MKYSNLLKTHFVVGASDIVGNQFKFVGLPAVMLRKGLNFVAARFACYCMFFGQDWWCRSQNMAKPPKNTQLYKQI